LANITRSNKLGGNNGRQRNILGFRGLNPLLNLTYDRINNKFIPPFNISMSLKMVTNNNILPYNNPGKSVLFGKMENGREIRTIGINLEACFE
jgi:hypothetical protein